jgi:DNA-binding NtrC family response regulator
MKVQVKRILIIDPDKKERQDLEAFLKKKDYHIESGRGLRDALKKISEGCYDCLIMDMDLPEMKGYEAVSIMKNIDPKIKVIMMTQKNTKKLEAKVREQDVFYYFIKSFGKHELDMAISNALNK